MRKNIGRVGWVGMGGGLSPVSVHELSSPFPWEKQ